MSDLAYDAVICGGGNKALMLAMYLTKYAGMSCGVFERRHEIGGGLATEEKALPGFGETPMPISTWVNPGKNRAKKNRIHWLQKYGTLRIDSGSGSLSKNNRISR